MKCGVIVDWRLEELRIGWINRQVGCFETQEFVLK